MTTHAPDSDAENCPSCGSGLGPHPAIRFIILHDTVQSSWLKDFGQIGSLVLLIWANHALGAGNWVVDALGAVLLLFWLVFRGTSLRYERREFTREELRQWARDQDIGDTYARPPL